MMYDCFIFLGTVNNNDRQNPLLPGYATTSTAAAAAAATDEFHHPTTAMTLILKSWLNGHRFRYLILVLFSPLLIPIVCVLFPFLCAAEVCFCICRRRRRRSKHNSSTYQSPKHQSSKSTPPPVSSTSPPVLLPCDYDVGSGEEVKRELSLLDRYLDDQLALSLEILDECGGDLGYPYVYVDDFDSNFDRNRIDGDLC